MTIKELGTILGVLVVISGGGVGYGRLQTQTVQVEEEVKEVREEVKENEKAIDVEENINIRQSIMLENTAKILERLEKKL